MHLILSQQSCSFVYSQPSHYTRETAVCVCVESASNVSLLLRSDLRLPHAAPFAPAGVTPAPLPITSFTASFLLSLSFSERRPTTDCKDEWEADGVQQSVQEETAQRHHWCVVAVWWWRWVWDPFQSQICINQHIPPSLSIFSTILAKQITFYHPGNSIAHIYAHLHASTGAADTLICNSSSSILLCCPCLASPLWEIKETSWVMKVYGQIRNSEEIQRCSREWETPNNQKSYMYSEDKHKRHLGQTCLIPSFAGIIWTSFVFWTK